MLQIDLIKHDNEGELIFDGVLDVNTSEEADKILKDVIERFDKLILNLGRVEYVSSAGLRILKRANINMRRKGGTLLLKDVTKSVMEVLELTGFAVMFKYL